MGEMERIALATVNSDLRSDLLAARQEIERLRVAGDALAEAYEWIARHHPEAVREHLPLIAWREARRER
jgi:hypothetical protein